MTRREQDEISRKIMSAVMLRDFAEHVDHAQKMHAALAAEAEAKANHLLEV